MNADEFQKTVIDQLVHITQEVTEIKQDITGLKQDVTGVKHEVTNIKQEVTGIKQEVKTIRQDQVRIENEHGEKIKALFDAQEVMIEKMERFNESQARIEDKLDRLALKVSVHDTILKRVK